MKNIIVVVAFPKLGGVVQRFLQYTQLSGGMRTNRGCAIRLIERCKACARPPSFPKGGDGVRSSRRIHSEVDLQERTEEKNNDR